MEINEKNLKEILKEQREEYQHFAKEQREEYQHYLGAMKEDFDSKVQLIAKQYIDIKETLDSHTEMIGRIEEDVEIIKLDIEFIKNDLNKKVDRDEFAVLERRVALLESKN